MKPLDDLCEFIEELGRASDFELAVFYWLVIFFMAAIPVLSLAGLFYLVLLIAEAR